MLVEQISIFVENKTGRLANVMSVLNANDIDIRAMTIADTTDFGILRIIVSDTEKAIKVLKENDCTAAVTEVIGFSISDAPGALYKVMDTLHENDISVEYLYAVMGRMQGKADIIIRVRDNDAALAVLKNNDITILTQSDIIA